jgi:hypothetical protein
MASHHVRSRCVHSVRTHCGTWGRRQLGRPRHRTAPDNHVGRKGGKRPATGGVLPRRAAFIRWRAYAQSQSPLEHRRAAWVLGAGHGAASRARFVPVALRSPHQFKGKNTVRHARARGRAVLASWQGHEGVDGFASDAVLAGSALPPLARKRAPLGGRVERQADAAEVRLALREGGAGVRKGSVVHWRSIAQKKACRRVRLSTKKPPKNCSLTNSSPEFEQPRTSRCWTRSFCR